MTDTMAPAPAPERRGYRRMRLGLIASLAVNVLLIGLMAGAFYHRHQHGAWRGGARHASLTAFAKTLPAERRKVIDDFVSERRKALKPLRADLIAARKEAAEALAAVPFDQEKLKAAFAKSAEADSKLKAAAMAIFAESAGLLTADERAALQKWREHKRRPWRRKYKSDEDDEAGGPPPAPPPAP